MSCWLLSPQRPEKASQFQHMNVTIHAMKPTEADLCFVSEAVQRNTKYITLCTRQHSYSIKHLFVPLADECTVIGTLPPERCYCFQR